MGVLNLSAVSQAKWFSMPLIPFADFGFSFNFSAIITMVIIYIVLMAETTGTWFAVSNVIDKPLTDKQINRGVIGEGIGCFIKGFKGSYRLTRAFIYRYEKHMGNLQNIMDELMNEFDEQVERHLMITTSEKAEVNSKLSMSVNEKRPYVKC